MLKNVVRAKMMEALKNGEKETKTNYSMLLAALESAEKDKRSELTNEEEVAVVSKLVKQTKETLALTPVERQDIIVSCNNAISLYGEFLPTQLGEDEVLSIINEVLAKLEIEKMTMKDKGRVMKELMPLVKGKVDGAIVNKLIENLAK